MENDVELTLIDDADEGDMGLEYEPDSVANVTWSAPLSRRDPRDFLGLFVAFQPDSAEIPLQTFFAGEDEGGLISITPDSIPRGAYLELRYCSFYERAPGESYLTAKSSGVFSFKVDDDDEEEDGGERGAEGSEPDAPKDAGATDDPDAAGDEAAYEPVEHQYLVHFGTRGSFISDVVIVNRSERERVPEGYVEIPNDLCAGWDGPRLVIAFKPEEEGSDAVPLTTIGVTYTNDECDDGKIPEDCYMIEETVSGGSAELNGGGGSYTIFLYVGYGEDKEPIRDIGVMDMDQEEVLPPGYLRVQYTCGLRDADLNGGTRAHDIYLYYVRQSATLLYTGNVVALQTNGRYYVSMDDKRKKLTLNPAVQSHRESLTVLSQANSDIVSFCTHGGGGYLSMTESGTAYVDPVLTQNAVFETGVSGGRFVFRSLSGHFLRVDQLAFEPEDDSDFEERAEANEKIRSAAAAAAAASPSTPGTTLNNSALNSTLNSLLNDEDEEELARIWTEGKKSRATYLLGYNPDTHYYANTLPSFWILAAVTDVRIAVTKADRVQNALDGFVSLGTDLSDGAKGAYVQFCCRRGGWNAPVTDIRIINSTNIEATPLVALSDDELDHPPPPSPAASSEAATAAATPLAGTPKDEPSSEGEAVTPSAYMAGTPTPTPSSTTKGKELVAGDEPSDASDHDNEFPEVEAAPPSPHDWIFCFSNLNEGMDDADELYLQFRRRPLIRANGTMRLPIYHFAVVIGRWAQAPPGYTLYPYDTNDTAGGSYVYLCYSNGVMADDEVLAIKEARQLRADKAAAALARAKAEKKRVLKEFRRERLALALRDDPSEWTYVPLDPTVTLCGMYNAGNTCYIDSLIMSMFSCTNVYDPLLFPESSIADAIKVKPAEPQDEDEDEAAPEERSSDEEGDGPSSEAAPDNSGGAAPATSATQILSTVKDPHLAAILRKASKLAALRHWLREEVVGGIRRGECLSVEVMDKTRFLLREAGWEVSFNSSCDVFGLDADQQDASELFTFLLDLLGAPYLGTVRKMSYKGVADPESSWSRDIHRAIMIPVPLKPKKVGAPPTPKTRKTKEKVFALPDLLRMFFFENPLEDFKRDVSPQLAALVAEKEAKEAQEKAEKEAREKAEREAEEAAAAAAASAAAAAAAAASASAATAPATATATSSTSTSDVPTSSATEPTSEAPAQPTLPKRKKKVIKLAKKDLPPWGFEYRLLPHYLNEKSEDREWGVSARAANVAGVVSGGRSVAVPILLKRFNNLLEKILCPIIIPEIIDASVFVVPNDDGSPRTGYTLHLRAVVCHSGRRLNSGHYYSFIRVDGSLENGSRTSAWMKFDDLNAGDDKLEQVDIFAVDENGDRPSEYQDLTRECFLCIYDLEFNGEPAV